MFQFFYKKNPGHCAKSKKQSAWSTEEWENHASGAWHGTKVLITVFLLNPKTPVVPLAPKR